MTTPRLGLMDLLAALSVTPDLGMGQPPETALRSSLLATRLVRAMELSESDVRNTCLGTLLRHVGCTATASPPSPSDVVARWRANGWKG